MDKIKNYLLGASLAGALASPVFAQDKLEAKPTNSNYAIVVSKTTYEDIGWRKVTDALTTKYPGARVHVYESSLLDILGDLSEQKPRHVAYVAQPSELLIPTLATDNRGSYDFNQELNAAHRSPVGSFNRLLTKLDEDPYPDAIGGIITGLTADYAVKLAESKPLMIRRGLFKALASQYVPTLEGSVGLSDGLMRDKEKPYVLHTFWQDGKVQTADLEVGGPVVVNELNSGTIDLVFFSGHANHSSWPINHDQQERNDLVIRRTVNGDIVALYPPYNTKESRADINCTNPKVVWGPGSCQTGRIKSPEESLALAWMKNGAVHFLGYTVDTAFGDAGWGGIRFFERDGLTVMDALHSSRIAIAHKKGKERDSRIARGEDELSFEEAKMDYEMFGFAGYGDPALDVRMQRKEGTLPTFTMQQKNEDGIYTFIARANEKGEFRDLVFLTDVDLSKSKIVDLTGKFEPSVIDNAVIFDIDDSKVERGNEWKLTLDSKLK